MVQTGEAFNPRWPISEVDYEAAKQVVKARLKPSDSILKVRISASKLTFETGTKFQREGVSFIFTKMGDNWPATPALGHWFWFT